MVSASGSRGCLPLSPGGVCLRVQGGCLPHPPARTPLGTHTPLIPQAHTPWTHPYASHWNTFLLRPANELCCKVMFLHVSVILSTGRCRCRRGHTCYGACVAGGGHAWQEGAYVAGGVHGRGCAWQGEHAWQRGACIAGGMCGGGRAWQERRPLQWSVRILLEFILVLTMCVIYWTMYSKWGYF